MKITSSKESGILSLALDGELDHHAAKSTMDKIGHQIDLELPAKTVLDLSKLSFMDSSGIAVAVTSFKKMQSVGGKLEIVNTPKTALKVFNAAKLNRLIDIK